MYNVSEVIARRERARSARAAELSKPQQATDVTKLAQAYAPFIPLIQRTPNAPLSRMLSSAISSRPNLMQALGYPAAQGSAMQDYGIGNVVPTGMGIMAGQQSPRQVQKPTTTLQPLNSYLTSTSRQNQATGPSLFNYAGITPNEVSQAANTQRQTTQKKPQMGYTNFNRR